MDRPFWDDIQTEKDHGRIETRRCQRRTPILHQQPARQGGIAGQDRTGTLGHRKQVALGAGRRISRGRLPSSRWRSGAKFRHPAPNCPQPAEEQEDDEAWRCLQEVKSRLELRLSEQGVGHGNLILHAIALQANAAYKLKSFTYYPCGLPANMLLKPAWIVRERFLYFLIGRLICCLNQILNALALLQQYHFQCG